jgi:hypothetical protein
MMDAACRICSERFAARRCSFGDRAHHCDALRQDLAARGASPKVRLIPIRVNLSPFNKRLNRKRKLVERYFNKLEHYRAVQPAMTNTATIISPASNLPQSEFGGAFMSRWPNVILKLLLKPLSVAVATFIGTPSEIFRSDFTDATLAHCRWNLGIANTAIEHNVIMN